MFDFLEEMVQVRDQQIALYQDHDDWLAHTKLAISLMELLRSKYLLCLEVVHVCHLDCFEDLAQICLSSSLVLNYGHWSLHMNYVVYHSYPDLAVPSLHQ
jgi:hypothetical protein